MQISKNIEKHGMNEIIRKKETSLGNVHFITKHRKFPRDSLEFIL
jgi:hypothetical protein